jgi:hypothetical protein
VVLAKYKRHTGKILTQSIIINFTAEGGPMSIPPVADAGVGQAVPTGTEVILDGSNSSDPNGNDLTYAWAIVDAPQSSNATLAGATTVDPVFTADMDGAYVIQLVVNNGTVDSDPDTVIITATGNGNTAPIADAGFNRHVDIGDMVTLDGSHSTDSDGDTLTYAWTIVAAPWGSSATLSDATAVKPTFIADVEGGYAIQLVVNDGVVDSNPATVIISADGTGGNSAPVADAGPDQQVSTGAMVVLDGTGSHDPDGDPLSYAWTIINAPQGSSADLSDATAVDPTFNADMDGTYVFQLMVDDGVIDSNPDTVTITATGNGNTAPTADAGDDQEVTIGTTVMLDGSGSSDVDGDPLSYAWTIVDMPQGSNAVLSTPTTSETVFFTPDKEGAYKIRLIVNDGSVNSNPDKVVVTATSSLGPDGEALYNQYCKSCHGADGTVNGDLTDMTADTLMSLLPHFGVEEGAIGGQEGAQAISDYITQ